MKKRCEWAKNEPNLTYHDVEWGVPQHDDRKLFEFLILEGAQAGLSWTTILNRRNGYREAFCNFDANLVSKLNQKDIEKLIQNPSIIRNKLKINSAINNAKHFLKIQKQFGTFDNYLWGFVNYMKRKQLKQDIFLSDDLKKSVEFLLHPIIFDECKYQLDNLNNKEYVVIVVPLLFETKNYLKLITKSLLIDCDEELQLTRVIERDDVSEAFAKKIISSQMSRKKKLQLADKVIVNNGNVDDLKNQLEKFYTALEKEKISA